MENSKGYFASALSNFTSLKKKKKKIGLSWNERSYIDLEFMNIGCAVMLALVSIHRPYEINVTKIMQKKWSVCVYFLILTSVNNRRLRDLLMINYSNRHNRLISWIWRIDHQHISWHISDLLLLYPSSPVPNRNELDSNEIVSHML